MGSGFCLRAKITLTETQLPATKAITNGGLQYKFVV